MKTLAKRLRAALAALAVPLLLSACGINAIPTKEETAKAKWADVQSQYQRRADLIPNLVATVKGYAAQERTVLNEVISARARATGVTVDPTTVTDPAKFRQFEQAQNALAQSLGRLLLIQERYPELRSNQNFLALQSQLEGTENRIGIARRDYNEAVRDFNTSLRTFPTVLWAKTLYAATRPMQLFQATAGAQGAPTVSFDQPAPAIAPPVQTTPAPAPAGAPPPQ